MEQVPTIEHPVRHRKLWIALAAIIVILVGMRIASSYVLESYVNNKLDESPKYSGQIGDIDLSLLTLSYAIDDVEIVKTEGNIPVPLFAATRIEFSVIMQALKNGVAVGQAELFDPQINLVDSTDESKKQTGSGGKWLDMIDDLFPMPLDRTIIHNGQLHFRNYDSDPKIDISLSSMNALAENIAMKQALTDSRLARLSLTALAMDESDLTLAVAYDPTAAKASFDVDAQLDALPVLKLDNFIRSYAPFDVEAGSMDVTSRISARDGVIDGFVKPTIHDLDVFSWREDMKNDHDSPFTVLWEGLIGFVAELKDDGNNEMVSVIPLHGTIDESSGNVFVAIAGVVKDGFREAYQVNLENTVSLLATGEPESVEMPPRLEEQAL